jgi:hypothetical protein
MVRKYRQNGGDSESTPSMEGSVESTKDRGIRDNTRLFPCPTPPEGWKERVSTLAALYAADREEGTINPFDYVSHNDNGGVVPPEGGAK